VTNLQNAFVPLFTTLSFYTLSPIEMEQECVQMDPMEFIVAPDFTQTPDKLLFKFQ
jgi:hypothetical protein